MIYHPDRYYRSRPFVKTLLSIYSQDARSGTPTLETFNAVTESFIRFYNSALSEMPFELRPTDTRQATEEISLFMHYGRFQRSGRNIFHFQPALTTLLRQTDVDDVILNAIKLPYDSFYIAFGQQSDLNLWDQGYLVDGAYISMDPDQATSIFQILLTTIRSDIDYTGKPNFVLNPDRYYYFPLRLTEKSITVRAAIDNSIAEHQPFIPKDAPDTAGTYFIEGRRVSVIDRNRITQIEATENSKKGFPIFLEAIKLIVNGLCYLSSQHREVHTRFPDDTPKGLLEKLARAKKPAEVSRTISKLASMGYSKINFCGDTIQQEHEKLPTGRELPSHWRRGHWRNQAHGEQYSAHKLIWIKPTLVRKDKGEPLSGHIYDVDENSQQCVADI